MTHSPDTDGTLMSYRNYKSESVAENRSPNFSHGWGMNKKEAGPLAFALPLMPRPDEYPRRHSQSGIERDPRASAAGRIACQQYLANSWAPSLSSALLPAVPAVNRSALGRLEGNLALGTAVRAGCLVHHARPKPSCPTEPSTVCHSFTLLFFLGHNSRNSRLFL